MRALLKGLGIALLLVLYVFLSSVIFLLPALRKTKRTASLKTASVFARIILSLLGVRVRVKHQERLHNAGHVRLIVANHLSYIDVLVLASLVPSVFITSVELKNTALLGTLARLSGCIFVERRTPSGLKREIGDIASVLGQGVSVTLFPEGTTSNGDRVQPFKNSLFDAAVVTRADIVPLCFRYTRVNEEPLSRRNRDAVFYYGGVTFLKHAPSLLALQSIEVEVIVLKTIKVHDGHTRKEIAALTHSAISAAYQG
jgi:1-acyl-sn-glycerol-3-phosphate acyltransferase